jgi:predicted lipoprotein with Yx(FWY)xxD motif
MTIPAHRRLTALAALPALSLALAACGGATTASHQTTVKPTGGQNRAAAVSAQTGGAVSIRSSQYGRILADGGGRALYLFTRDSSPRSQCFGACAAAWPPYLTRGAPIARGVQGALLGTTRRADGSLQVTYRGHPLYYYVGDHKPSDVLCQGVPEFGGTWYVVSPGGVAIH